MTIPIALSMLIAIAVSAAEAKRDSARLPPLESVGGHELPLVACGVRDTAWVEHFAAALYANRAEAAIILDPGAPKVLRLEVRSGKWLPDGIPGKYRQPFESALTTAQVQRLSHALAGLTKHDEVVVSYNPKRDVRITVNGELIAATRNHDLVAALLAAWSGDEPSGPKLQKFLDEHRC